MGLCKSRARLGCPSREDQKGSSPRVNGAKPVSRLRADAEPFVPRAKWPDASWGMAMPPEVVEEKGEVKRKKKKKRAPLARAISRGRQQNPSLDLFAVLSPKSTATAASIVPPSPTRCVDDTAVSPRAHARSGYLSADEDTSGAHRHLAPCRSSEYVPAGARSQGLDDAVAALMRQLHALKRAELALDRRSRRYSLGFRETQGAVSKGTALAVVVALDVGPETGGTLEEKIQQITAACAQSNVPALFALSRQKLGATISKKVAISILAIHDVRGAEREFEQVVAEAATLANIG